VTSSEFIERVAACAYRNGMSPLELAELVVEMLARETLDLPSGDPAALLLARRVTGAMLDMDWAPPGFTDHRETK
jgi:hypothetical protein